MLCREFELIISRVVKSPGGDDQPIESYKVETVCMQNLQFAQTFKKLYQGKISLSIHVLKVQVQVLQSTFRVVYSQAYQVWVAKVEVKILSTVAINSLPSSKKRSRNKSGESTKRYRGSNLGAASVYGRSQEKYLSFLNKLFRLLKMDPPFQQLVVTACSCPCDVTACSTF